VTDYYISASKGCDENDGMNENTPWKTLGKINAHTFAPGDRILLKGCDLWADECINISPASGSGTSQNPIVVSSYGEGRPKIAYNAADKGRVVLLKNVGGWTINGLELHIKGGVYLQDDKIANSGIGIYAEFDADETFSDIIISDNLVYGDSIDRNTRGIVVNSIHHKKWEKYACENIKIISNTVHDIGWAGIYTSSSGRLSPHVYANVHIVRNTVYDMGCNGIVMGNVTRGVLNRNILRGGGLVCDDTITWGAGGIWPWFSKDIEFKFNEASHMLDNTIGHDGTGLNIDWFCENVDMQYNYAHDNIGVGISTMSITNCVIANNRVERNRCVTSIGKGQIAMSDFMGNLESNGVSQTKITDNVIIVDETSGIAVSAVHFTEGKAWDGNIVENNHIVCLTDKEEKDLYNIPAAEHISPGVFIGQNRIIRPDPET